MIQYIKEEVNKLIAVSACLLGENCKYNGKNNQNEDVINFLQNKKYIAICPEVMGGLSTPRPPSEILGEKVITKNGLDLTQEFRQGAKLSLDLCLKHNVKLAILKSNSPSCGSKTIYDGTFNHVLISGQGITTQLLTKNSIKVIDETSLKK